MDIKELRNKYQALLAEAKKMLSEGKNAEAEAKMGEADAVKAQIDTALKIEAGQRFLDDPANTPVSTSWRPAGPDEGNAPIDGKSWREVQVGAKTIRFNVPIAVEKKEYQQAFEAYLRKGFGGLGPNDRKTLSEGTDTAGGFLVPGDFHAELIKKQATSAIVRSLARVVSTSRDMATWPRVNYTTDDKYTSGVRLTWTGETPASSTAHRVTDPVFGQFNIPVHTAMASLPLTNVLIEDASFDVLGIASDLIAEAFSLGEDDIFINGTGVNQPLGLLTQVDGDGPASVASGTSSHVYTSSDAHNGKRLIDLYYTLPAQYRRNAVWMMASGTMQEVDNLVDGNKRPIISALQTASIAMGEPNVIKGRPVYIDEFVPALAASSYSVIFGDFKGYIVLDRVGLSVQVLREIYAETDITLLLAKKRLGAYCAEPYRFKVMKCNS